MKKFFIIAFFLVALGLIAIAPNGEFTNKATATSTGAIFIMPGVNPSANYNIKVEGDQVIVNWSSNRFMDGYVIVENDNFYQEIEEKGGLKTYHTVIFNLAPGNYTIQPISTFIFREFKMPTREITIEIDEEITDFVPLGELNIEWAIPLYQEQIEELIELYYKPHAEWTETDAKNWNYAVR